jgi:hypothetical protein
MKQNTGDRTPMADDRDDALRMAQQILTQATIQEEQAFLAFVLARQAKEEAAKMVRRLERA